MTQGEERQQSQRERRSGAVNPMLHVNTSRIMLMHVCLPSTASQQIKVGNANANVEQLRQTYKTQQDSAPLQMTRLDNQIMLEIHK